MKTLTLLILSLTTLTFMSGCERQELDVWTYYDENTCADPWQPSTNIFVMQANVAEYLAAEGIEVRQVNVTDSGTPRSCNACNCYTGRRVRVNVTDTDVQKVLDRGFKIEN